MAGSKSNKGYASKVSSRAATAAPTTTQATPSSSIIRSLFSPSLFQLSLFASVIQALDGQQLRIHDVRTGRMRCEHAIKSKASINCLDWGYYGENHSDRYHQESNKKRKRITQANLFISEPKNFVVAFGTSDSEILMFSPTESKITGTLRGEHSQGVKDFKFVDSGVKGRAWSIGGDSTLIQWDLRQGQSLRSLSAPATSIATLHPLDNLLLCASHTTYLINPDSLAQPSTFTTSSYPIHTIKSSTPQKGPSTAFLTASDSERGITVFDITTQKLIGTLLPGAEAKSIALSLPITNRPVRNGTKETADHLQFPEQTLAAVNKDGILELFPAPFQFPQTSAEGSDTVKNRVKQMTRRPVAVVKITRPESTSSHVPLLDCAFDGDDIVMAWTEGGVSLVFNRVKWCDETSGKLLLRGTNDLIKSKSGADVTAATMNGVKDMGQSHVDESHTVIRSGKEAGDSLLGVDPSSAIDITSGEEESEYSNEEEEGSDKETQPVSEHSAVSQEDISMEDAQPDAEIESDADTGALDKLRSPEEAGEPTFGDLVRANAPEAIDIQGNFPSTIQDGLARTDEHSHNLPSGLSLGTVLTQSLRTNDVNLLETCFHVKDLATVRATIERIDSSLATILLDRLAERLHSRPGRAGSLMVWVQWTLVVHGGYLSSQPELMRRLSSLHRVVSERANSLHSLLSLKGKLDMLEAQLNLRKAMHARSNANTLDDEDEEGVIYVEGQEDSESEGDDMDFSAPEVAPSMETAKTSLQDTVGDMEDSGEEEEEVVGEEEDNTPVKMNGVIPDSEEEGSESESGGLIDDEVESTDNDSGDERTEDEVNYDDADSLSEESSELEEAPPTKRPAKARLVNGVTKKTQ